MSSPSQPCLYLTHHLERARVFGATEMFQKHSVVSGRQTNLPLTRYYKATQDWLVQWDHGAPGVSAALLAGWTATGNESYRASAEKALDCTWRRGMVSSVRACMIAEMIVLVTRQTMIDFERSDELPRYRGQHVDAAARRESHR